nr:uroporphyrinogen decarboxylase family protein [Candidatus Sigynarchaeota archaeon]
MDHVERFYATIEREEVDRPASWLGIPVKAAQRALFNHFKVKDTKGLKRKIDDDVWDVEIPYHNPPSNHVACAFEFAKTGSMEYEKRTLTAPGFFEDIDDPSRVDEFDWPDPAEHIDPEECKAVVENVPEGYPTLGVIWSAHFQDVYSAFGMERAIIKMFKSPAMVHAVSKKIVEFYLKANKIFFDATKGHLDAILIGNDFGGQTRLMLSPANIKKFAMPGSRLIVEQAKSYGLKVFYHSCGSVFEAIPVLLDLGIDVLHPIQALATDMEPERLKEHYGDRLSFCGGVDAQQLLVNGSP